MAHKQQMATAAGQETTILTDLAGSSSSSQDKPFIFSQAKVEDVTPVNARLRSKALRPPVTIKSFFKPKAGSSAETEVSGGFTQSQQTVKPVTGAGMNGKTEIVEPRTVKVESAEREFKEVDEIDKNKPTVKDGSGVDEDSSCRSSTQQLEKGEGSREAENPDIDLPETQQLNEMGKDTGADPPPARKGKKRKTDQISTQAKTKQCKSVDNVKPGADQSEQGKEKRCPICNKKFSAGTWNDEINAHIDNCLIEWLGRERVLWDYKCFRADWLSEYM